MTPLTLEERETILLTSEADGTWSISTYNSALKRKLARMHDELHDECKPVTIDKESGYAEYIVSKKNITITIKKPRNDSEELSAIRRERMRKLAESQWAERNKA